MLYNFKFKINHTDLFNSSINYSKNSKTKIFDFIITFVALVVIVYTIYDKSFFQFSFFKQILLIICLIMFPIIQPIVIYIKSVIRIIKIGQIETNLVFDDEKITVSAKNEVSEVRYENVYNFIKYKNMIVVMYDSIHGQIMPNRIFNNNKEKFFKDVSDKIIFARERMKNEAIQ